MVPFFGWDSTFSRLQNYYEEAGVPGTHLINFGGMKGRNNFDLEATQQI